jgi:hypothetical protein
MIFSNFFDPLCDLTMLHNAGHGCTTKGRRLKSALVMSEFIESQFVEI